MVGGLNYQDLCTCKEVKFVYTADGGYRVHDVGCGCMLTKTEYLEMQEEINRLKTENEILKAEHGRLVLLYKDHQQNCMPIRYKVSKL